MELTVIRKLKGSVATEGEMLVNGQHECVTLEPVDRGLDSSMTWLQIKAKKIWGLTAIPVGRYQVKPEKWGAPYNRLIPVLQDVKGFTDIGIHSVGTHNDTHGCIGVGSSVAGPDLVAAGFAARDILYRKIFAAFDRSEDVFITICYPGDMCTDPQPSV